MTSSSAENAGDLAGPVVVGVDGSSNATRALLVAARLARALDTELAVFHALGLMTVINGEHVPSEGHHDEIEQVMGEQWCSVLQGDADLHWMAEIVLGSPTDVLMTKADDLAASFVVVGSRGARDEVSLGSTSTYLVHHCGHSVVVVPPADRLGR